MLAIFRVRLLSVPLMSVAGFAQPEDSDNTVPELDSGTTHLHAVLTRS
jgi:hypothetical protein